MSTAGGGDQTSFDVGFDMVSVDFCFAERRPSMLCCVSLEILYCPVDWSAEQGYTANRIIKRCNSFLQLRKQANVWCLEEELGLRKCKRALVTAHGLCQVLSVSHRHWHIRCGPA